MALCEWDNKVVVLMIGRKRGGFGHKKLWDKDREGRKRERVLPYDWNHFEKHMREKKKEGEQSCWLERRERKRGILI